MKIIPQGKVGTMTETDRLELVRILAKAGYTVRLGKEKSSKPNGAYIPFVEYCGPGENFEYENG